MSRTQQPPKSSQAPFDQARLHHPLHRECFRFFTSPSTMTGQPDTSGRGAQRQTLRGPCGMPQRKKVIEIVFEMWTLVDVSEQVRTSVWCPGIESRGACCFWSPVLAGKRSSQRPKVSPTTMTLSTSVRYRCRQPLAISKCEVLNSHLGQRLAGQRPFPPCASKLVGEGLLDPDSARHRRCQPLANELRSKSATRLASVQIYADEEPSLIVHSVDLLAGEKA